MQQLPLAAPETIIGSATTAHVALPYPSVNPQHARISMSDGRYVVEDLSGGKTQVSFNGDPSQLRLVQRNALRDNSLLQLGEERFVFRQLPAQTPRLERRYSLTQAGITVGADAACDVVVPGNVARQLRIMQEGGRWVTESLGGGNALVSYNGDPTQERPLVGRNALKSGSTIRIGTMTLRLE